jgi:hypothetical protein
MAYTYCKKCEIELKPGDQFCGKCGKPAVIEGITKGPVFATSLMVALRSDNTPNPDRLSENRQSTPFLDDLEIDKAINDKTLNPTPPPLPDEVAIDIDDIVILEEELLAILSEDDIELVPPGERPQVDEVLLVFGPPRRKPQP